MRLLDRPVEVLGLLREEAELLERVAKRVAFNCAIALAVILASLFAGMLGYRYLEGLGWVDSCGHAAMILGGMGPVNALQTNAGKIFASFYALYSGIILLAWVVILVTPIFHRFMHRFHLELEDN